MPRVVWRGAKALDSVIARSRRRRGNPVENSAGGNLGGALRADYLTGLLRAANNDECVFSKALPSRRRRTAHI